MFYLGSAGAGTIYGKTNYYRRVEALPFMCTPHPSYSYFLATCCFRQLLYFDLRLAPIEQWQQASDHGPRKRAKQVQSIAEI